MEHLKGKHISIINGILSADPLDQCLPEEVFELVIEQQALSHFTNSEGPVRCVVCGETLSRQRRLAFTISDYGICTDSACLGVLRTLYFEAKALAQVVEPTCRTYSGRYS